MRRVWLALLAGSAGCGFTPLTNKVGVGSEPFVVVVGQGRDGAVDLFAAPAEGGRFYQFTVNQLVESNPTVAPSGTRLAFLRQADGRPVEVVTLKGRATLVAEGPERALPIATYGEMYAEPDKRKGLQEFTVVSAAPTVLGA